MRIPRSAVVGSAAIAAVLIGLLIGFPHLGGRSPPPRRGQAPAQKAAAKGHEAAGIDPPDHRAGQADVRELLRELPRRPTPRATGSPAQNLPIKPQNLTEGRILNALPDHFLHQHHRATGAQAVGLSPLMPNFKPFLSDVQIREVIAYVRTLAEPAYDPAKVLPVADQARRGRCSRSSSAT